MLSYRAILKQAWRISWKNRFLWFFGFFASIVSFTAEFKVIAHAFNQGAGIRSLGNLQMFLNTGVFSKNAWTNILGLFKTDPKSIIFTLLTLLIIIGLIAFFAWLSTSSQVGIIDSVNKLLKGRPGKLNLKNGLKKGTKKFWPVFFMNLLISLIINIIYLLISFLLIMVIIKNQSLSTILYGFIFLVFVPISLFLAFMVKYAIAYVVIENKSFFKALQDGWKLFTQNWLISIEITILLFFINIIAALIIAIILFVGFFLLFSLALSSIFILSSGFLFWLILAIGVLFFIAVMVLGGSILNTFQITSWTDLFIQLRDKGGYSKIERVFQEK
jgi:hypothetical protein